MPSAVTHFYSGQPMHFCSGVDTYAHVGTVSEVQDDLRRRGILSKRWTSSTGRTRGGVNFNRGSLYWLLRNPVYIGQVTHKGQIYEGRQQAIVDRALWERAHELLTAKRPTGPAPMMMTSVCCVCPLAMVTNWRRRCANESPRPRLSGHETGGQNW